VLSTKKLRVFKVKTLLLPQVSIGQQIYAHRAIPSILVQEIRLANPTAQEVKFKVACLKKVVFLMHDLTSDNLFQMTLVGIVKWDSAKSRIQTFVKLKINEPNGLFLKQIYLVLLG
jgi:hypothetical protein